MMFRKTYVSGHSEGIFCSDFDTYSHVNNDVKLCGGCLLSNDIAMHCKQHDFVAR